ncbi:hypothetical protein ACLOB2_10760 [Levilactobacillus brevis]|uniref:hypothetical protein n=1 Tax=Levilactobacillus brevis TaxID=1580 RepID=UPI003EBFADAF
MAQSSLEKKEDKLKQLNQKIQDEKKRLEQKLGKQIISQAKLDYAQLSNEQIITLSQKIAAFLKENPKNHE